MIKALGEYFVGLFVQGVVLGGLAYLAYVVAWPWTLLPAVPLLYLFWRLPKNPRTHWKRMFSLLMGAALVGGALKFLAELEIAAEDLGYLSLLVRYAPGVEPWFLFGLAAVVAAADVFHERLYLRQVFADGRLWGADVPGSGRVSVRPDDSRFDGSGEALVGLTGGASGVRITGCTLSLKSLLWWIAPEAVTVEFRRADEVQWREGVAQAPRLEPDGELRVRFDFDVTRRVKRMMLFWWRINRRIPLLPRMVVLDMAFDGPEGRQLTVEAALTSAPANHAKRVVTTTLA